MGQTLFFHSLLHGMELSFALDESSCSRYVEFSELALDDTQDTNMRRPGTVIVEVPSTNHVQYCTVLLIRLFIKFLGSSWRSKGIHLPGTFGI